LHPISKNDKNAGVVNGAVGINKLRKPWAVTSKM
jgi:hypothetical protein